MILGLGLVALPCQSLMWDTLQLLPLPLALGVGRGQLVLTLSLGGVRDRARHAQVNLCQMASCLGQGWDISRHA